MSHPSPIADALARWITVEAAIAEASHLMAEAPDERSWADAVGRFEHRMEDRIDAEYDLLDAMGLLPANDNTW